MSNTNHHLTSPVNRAERINHRKRQVDTKWISHEQMFVVLMELIECLRFLFDFVNKNLIFSRRSGNGWLNGQQRLTTRIYPLFTARKSTTYDSHINFSNHFFYHKLQLITFGTSSTWSPVAFMAFTEYRFNDTESDQEQSHNSISNKTAWTLFDLRFFLCKWRLWILCHVPITCNVHERDWKFNLTITPLHRLQSKKCFPLRVLQHLRLSSVWCWWLFCIAVHPSTCWTLNFPHNSPVIVLKVH